MKKNIMAEARGSEMHAENTEQLTEQHTEQHIEQHRHRTLSLRRWALLTVICLCDSNLGNRTKLSLPTNRNPSFAVPSVLYQQANVGVLAIDNMHISAMRALKLWSINARMIISVH